MLLYWPISPIPPVQQLVISMSRHIKADAKLAVGIRPAAYVGYPSDTDGYFLFIMLILFLYTDVRILSLFDHVDCDNKLLKLKNFKKLKHYVY